MNRLFRVFIASTYLGFKSLGSPQGLFTGLALVFSIAAYVRASISITDVYFVFDREPSWSFTERLDDNGNWKPIDYTVPSFKMIVASAGSRSIYVNGLVLNVTPTIESASFNEKCTYLLPPKNGMIELVHPFSFSLKPTGEEAEFNVGNGFYVPGDSAVTFDASLIDPIEAYEAEVVTGDTGSAQIVKQLQDARIYEMASGSLDFSVCITGLIVASGGPPERFTWTDERNEIFSIGIGSALFGRSPNLPVESEKSEFGQREFSIYSPLFFGEMPIIRKWSIHLF